MSDQCLNNLHLPWPGQAMPLVLSPFRYERPGHCGNEGHFMDATIDASLRRSILNLTQSDPTLPALI